MTAKDIKPTNPDAEAKDAKADDTDEARKTERKTNAYKSGR